MCSGPDGRPSHEPVRAEDGGGLAVDGQAPAGVVNVGQNHDPRGLEAGLDLDALGLVARDGDGLGRIGLGPRQVMRLTRAETGTFLAGD